MKLRTRALATLGLLAGMFGAAGLLGAAPAWAHPLGNFTLNRYSGIELSPRTVRVHYVLDMAEIPTYQEQPTIDANGDGTVTTAERQAWADAKAPEILAHIALSVGGRSVGLRVIGAAMRFRPGQGGLPILRFAADFTGALPRTGSLSYRDSNYADHIGWQEITASSANGVAIARVSVPANSVSNELLAYPVDLLSSPLKVHTATLSFRPGVSTVGGNAGSTGKTVSGAPAASGGSFARLVQWKLTPLVLVVSLLLAFAFGGIHALGPGHGKTIMAAYLVGRGAKRRQVAAVGLAVSLMHTASVLILGVVALVLFREFPTERVYPYLGLATGLVVVGLGTALLITRVRARRRSVDPWHGHSHPHVPERELVTVGAASAASVHEHASIHEHHEEEHLHSDERTGHGHGHDHGHGQVQVPLDRPLSSRGLAALAVSGGLLPSPTALVVLTSAVSFHRLGYGLGLIAAFSVGLATALILVGSVAIRARSLMSKRLGGTVAGVLPLISAAIILSVGAFVTLRAVFQL